MISGRHLGGRRFATIQWLRAAAAFLVVGEHARNEIWLSLYGASPGEIPPPSFPTAAGVDIFFVISGFVMAASSAALYRRPGARSAFLVRRLARIVPLYWLMTLLLILIFFIVGRDGWQALTPDWVIGSLLFFPVENSQGAIFPVLTPGWTLNYEVGFYLLIALCLGWRQAIALSLAMSGLGVLVLFGWIYRPVFPALAFWTQPIILEFVGGIVVFVALRAGVEIPGKLRFLIALAAIALLWCSGLFGWTYDRTLVWGGPALLLVFAAVAGPDPRLPAMPARTGLVLGEISYAVYLAHIFVILVLAEILQRVGIQATWAWLGAFPVLVFSGTILAAACLHYSVERPAMKLGRKWSERILRRARPDQTG